jgi:hypothetical protein
VAYFGQYLEAGPAAFGPRVCQVEFANVLVLDRRETAMRAFEVFAIYVMPFLIIGMAIRFLMKRYAVDLPDVEKQARSKPRRRFLLGAWRTED